jgi:selenocysteine lyase/cysteine desulfurase
MNSRISSTIDISEFPIISWITGNFIRISIQCYNDESDINALMNALTHLIPF